MSGRNWSEALAPDLDSIAAIAKDAHSRLPVQFKALTGSLVFQVQDFPDPDVIEDMGLETPFDLLGLFVGVGLPEQGATGVHGLVPNAIFLFRRPILDLWSEGEETLSAIVTHVLIHEIGHHFGLSDEDMDAIEAAADQSS